jgi:hypothetical protein
MGNCPKCGNRMEIGRTSYNVRISIEKIGDPTPELIDTIYCPDCGYVEWCLESKLDRHKHKVTLF